MASRKKATAIGSVSNDAAEQISFSEPYIVELKITGVAPMLFHRWSCVGVDEKAKAAKGSKAKKCDIVEDYVYRMENGDLALPAEYLRQSILHAAKFKQDPRSPRKCAYDLYKAGVLAQQELCSLGMQDWDYIDRRRAVVQRSAITRQRPALRAGWSTTVMLQVSLPEYISPDDLSEMTTNAGRLIGVGDFRPTFGRFRVDKFEVIDLSKMAN